MKIIRWIPSTRIPKWAAGRASCVQNRVHTIDRPSPSRHAAVHAADAIQLEKADAKPVGMMDDQQLGPPHRLAVELPPVLIPRGPRQGRAEQIEIDLPLIECPPDFCPERHCTARTPDLPPRRCSASDCTASSPWKP